MNKNIVSILGSWLGLVIFLWLCLFVAINAFYVVDETEQVVITQFGKPIGRPITEAGLHMKLPFIQQVNSFDRRVLEWDGDADQIPTKDKRYIWVDTTARWKISDALKFYKSVQDTRNAQSRLDDIIDSVVRTEINNSRLIEIVRTTNRVLDEARAGKDDVRFSKSERISRGREEIRQKIFQEAKTMVADLGIELIDVQIKRVNYVEEVRRKVYERMKAERKRAAEEYRSQGRGEQAKIQGQMERELKQIRSQAYKEAEEIKGEAEAKALKIYADAYSKGAEFYDFIKSLDTYKKIADTNTTLILTTSSEYLKFFNSDKIGE